MTTRLVAVLACSASLSGGVILNAPSADAQQIAAPVWRVAEDIRIDGTKEEFTYRGFILVDRDGDIAFGDIRRYEVRFYDHTGKHRLNFGGRGRGPGEFFPGGKAGAFSGGTVGDSIWIHDPVGRRLTFATRDGKLLRTVNVPSFSGGRSGSYQPLAVYGDGSILGLHELAPATPEGSKREQLVLLSSGVAARSVAILAPPDQRVQVRDPSTGRSMVWSAPMAARPLRAVAQDGNRVLLVTQQMSGPKPTLTVVVVSRTGDTLVNRRFAVSGRPIARNEIDRNMTTFTRELAGANSDAKVIYSKAFIDEIERKMRAVFPRFAPPVSYAVIGLDHTIWLRWNDQQATKWYWVVLDPQGTPIGRLETPAQLNISHVTSTHLWSIQFDDDGVPSLVRYRIHRG